MTTTSPPFAALHAELMARQIRLDSGSDAHDDFSAILITYQQCAGMSDRLDGLARLCERRAARPGLPLDLVAAYASLAQLARWRIGQLTSGPIVQAQP